MRLLHYVNYHATSVGLIQIAETLQLSAQAMVTPPPPLMVAVVAVVLLDTYNIL